MENITTAWPWEKAEKFCEKVIEASSSVDSHSFETWLFVRP